MLRVRSFFAAAALMALATTHTVAQAEPGSASAPAIATMAQIMIDLNHRPDAGGRAALEDLLEEDDTTANERNLARVILNLDHRPSRADKAKLREVLEDDLATAHEQALAEILLALNHRPSARDKGRLRAMIN